MNFVGDGRSDSRQACFIQADSPLSHDQALLDQTISLSLYTSVDAVVAAVGRDRLVFLLEVAIGRDQSVFLLEVAVGWGLQRP